MSIHQVPGWAPVTEPEPEQKTRQRSPNKPAPPRAPSKKRIGENWNEMDLPSYWRPLFNSSLALARYSDRSAAVA